MLQLELKQLGTALAVVIRADFNIAGFFSVKAGHVHSDPVFMSLRQHLPNPVDKLRIEMEEIFVAEVKNIQKLCSFDMF